jgi:methylase of polypeptide subunit release factors
MHRKPLTLRRRRHRAGRGVRRCTVQWNTNTEREPLMHRIHSYPAKFPSFIASRALTYARKLGVDVRCMADIFCGCGTTALEARREGVDFWGCDINPVATLIARVKSNGYQAGRLRRYQSEVIKRFCADQVQTNTKFSKRLHYWFGDQELKDLCRLLRAIRKLPRGKYREFFLCAFSNILKPVSRWLTKSIKPQVDPSKVQLPVFATFVTQCDRMLKAVSEQLEHDEASTQRRKRKCNIRTGDFLKVPIKHPVADLLVTSPPYVTSYEYADLHQLSALWLGYTEDYRDLRNGSIGSLHQCSSFKRDVQKLDVAERSSVSQLYRADPAKGKAATRYFLEMRRVVAKTRSVLRPGGLLLLVVGNTAYQGVELNVARYLRRCLQRCGYHDVSRTRRRISFKTLTPYRDRRGRFTRNARGRKVYAEEFVLTARR